MEKMKIKIKNLQYRKMWQSSCSHVGGRLSIQKRNHKGEVIERFNYSKCQKYFNQMKMT